MTVTRTVPDRVREIKSVIRIFLRLAVSGEMSCILWYRGIRYSGTRLIPGWIRAAGGDLMVPTWSALDTSIAPTCRRRSRSTGARRRRGSSTRSSRSAPSASPSAPRRRGRGGITTWSPRLSGWTNDSVGHQGTRGQARAVIVLGHTRSGSRPPSCRISPRQGAGRGPNFPKHLRTIARSGGGSQRPDQTLQTAMSYLSGCASSGVCALVALRRCEPTPIAQADHPLGSGDNPVPGGATACRSIRSA
jgi:hypothetical protein